MAGLDATTIIVIVILLFLGGGIGTFFYRRVRANREEEPVHFRCPGCRHKLKYYARQVGHRGMCTNCKEVFVFPPVLEVHQ